MFKTPEQRELSKELRSLGEKVSASNVFIFDAWGLIWAYAEQPVGEKRDRLFAQLKSILEGLDPRLERGGRLEGVHEEATSPMYCVSFAATYAIGLWTTADTNEFRMRSAVKKALPRIEAMTLSLPPPDGSGTSSGAQHGRA